MIYAVIGIDRNACQAAAISERKIADGSDGVGDDDAFKTVATIERALSDGSDGVGDDGVCKVVAILEHLVCDGSSSFFDDIFAGKRGVGFDQILSNVKDAIFPVALTVVICGIGESILADGSDGVADCNACKFLATQECPCADGSDRVGDSDACKVAAITERQIADGSDGVRDSDA